MTRRLLVTAAVLVALVAVDGLLQTTRRSFDLTAERTLTLTDQTLEVARAVKDRVEITALIPRTERRAEAASLLGRYRQANRRISWTIVDPIESPGRLRALGVDPIVDAVAIRRGSDIEKGPTLSEQDVTSALARIVRDRSPAACFSAGHGEAAIDDSTEVGLASMADQLRANGYRPSAVDLVRGDVPSDCDVLIVLAPVAGVPSGLDAWLDKGRPALVLTDPGDAGSAEVFDVVRGYGIDVRRGAVLEGDPEQRLLDDLSTALPRDHRSASPVARRLPPVLFPGAWGLVESSLPSAFAEPTVVPVVRTSTLSYLETDPANASFDPESDLAGPVTLVMAADVSENVGGRVRRTRLVVTGDADFATNTFIG
ncbi:MAG TPA: Gldg family protein, partial [Acidimicrobiales bacterium]|nr:Gldg family protein [Acidimicrobiales bacterium]